MKVGCMKRLLATVSLVVGCCFAYGGDFSGTWTDPDSGLIWSYEYVEDWGDGLILTEFTGECPESLTIPSSIAVVQGVGEEVVTNDYAVAAVGESCCAELDGLKSVAIPPSVSFIYGDAFARCGSLEEVRFLGNVPAYDSDFEFRFETTFEGTPYLEKLRAENANDLAENAKEISGASGTVRGDNMLATPNEPDFPADGTNDEETFDPLRGYAGWLVGSKWYKWTAPATTTVWFDTKGSDFNTVLGAYEISWNPDDPTQVAWIFLGENGGFNGKTSLVSFKAVQGRTYYICVGGNLENDESRARGNIVLNWRTGAAVTLTLQTPNPKKSGAYLTYKRLPVPKGKPVGVLPQPKRDGYSFTGWYTKKAGGAKVTASTKFTKATTLYARWTLRKYRVTLVSGEGCASVSGQGLHPYGSTVTISAVAQPGYKFYGWEISEWVPSATAFTNYGSLWRKNQTAKVKMPAGNVMYTAKFVKENEDFLSLVVGGESVGAAPDTGPWYAEQTPSLAVPVVAYSQTYPTVTTSKLPTGTAFKLVNNDCEYVFSVPDTSKLPPGRNVVKVMAQNRWGKTMYANLVVFGRNKTAANAWLTGIETSALEPYPMTVGITPSFADLGIVPVKGCTIAKMTGLPAGLAWDAKKKQFTGYPTRAGVYTVTITAAKKVGKKLASKVSTITVVVGAVPDGLTGTFNGHTRILDDQDDQDPQYILSRDSLPVTLTVASTGKLTAKVGTSSFSGGGLKEIPGDNGDRYEAKFQKKTVSKVGKNQTRTVTESLTLTINPQADNFGSAFELADSWYFRQDVIGGNVNISPDTRVAGRLNMFGKDADGNVKDEQWATIANLAAERGEMELYVWRHKDFDDQFRFTSSPNLNPSDDTNTFEPVTELVDEGNGPYPAQVTLKVSVNAETGVATLAGALDGNSLDGTAVLSPEADPDTVGALANAAFARFFIGKYVIEVKWLLHPGPAAGDIGGIGDPSGRIVNK